MKTATAIAPAAPAHFLDRQKLAAIGAGFASTGLLAGKFILALPFFAMGALVFALHLVLPSEEHW